MNLKIMMFLVPRDGANATARGIFSSLATRDEAPLKARYVEHEDLETAPVTNVHLAVEHNAMELGMMFSAMAREAYEESGGARGGEIMEVILAAYEGDSGMCWIEQGCDVSGPAISCGGDHICAAIAGWYAGLMTPRECQIKEDGFCTTCGFRHKPFRAPKPTWTGDVEPMYACRGKWVSAEDAACDLKRGVKIESSELIRLAQEGAEGWDMTDGTGEAFYAETLIMFRECGGDV